MGHGRSDVPSPLASGRQFGKFPVTKLKLLDPSNGEVNRYAAEMQPVISKVAVDSGPVESNQPSQSAGR